MSEIYASTMHPFFSLLISKFSTKFFGHISTSQMLNVIVYCVYSTYKYGTYIIQSLAFTIKLLTYKPFQMNRYSTGI